MKLGYYRANLVGVDALLRIGIHSGYHVVVRDSARHGAIRVGQPWLGSTVQRRAIRARRGATVDVVADHL